MSFLKKFVPKSFTYYEFFGEIATNLVKASELLLELIMSKGENAAEVTTQLHIIEHKCDDLLHKIVNELNETFITPIDREDIHSLANAMDNVIDSIDVVGSRIHLYKVKSQIEFGSSLAEILVAQTKLIKEVVDTFNDLPSVQNKLIQIRSYETEGDKVFREAISSLFENERDVFELIKKKEIIEVLENAIDRCQTVATVTEGVLIKNI